MIRITPFFSTVTVPREDTGVIPIACPYPLNMVDLAVFSVYDPLTRNTVLQKVAQKGANNFLFISLGREDTYNLAANTYYWDVKLYTGPHYDEEGAIIDADQINSLFSAYKLPKFIVKEVPNHG